MWKWKGSKLQEYIITSRTNWWLIPQRMTSIRASLDHGFAPHIYPICLVWVSQSLPREQTAPRQPRGFHNYLGAWRHQSGISRHHLPNHRGYGELKNQGSIPVHQSLLADVFRKAGVSPTAKPEEHGPDPLDRLWNGLQHCQLWTGHAGRGPNITKRKTKIGQPFFFKHVQRNIENESAGSQSFTIVACPMIWQHCHGMPWVLDLNLTKEVINVITFTSPSSWGQIQLVPLEDVPGLVNHSLWLIKTLW